MKDSILKGTGNSRFLKSAVPAGTSWADALAMLQAGTFPIDFNGINTEGFQQVGTPLNKANLLKDATAAQIGLPPSTTPDGMFQALGNTGELHVWRKTVKNAADVPAGYNLGAKTQMNIAKTQYSFGSDIALYIDVASSVTVSDSGDVSLSNATRSNISLQSNYSSKIQSSVRGKFVTFTPVRSGIVTTPSGIYFIPSDATVSYTYSEGGNPVFAHDISAAQTVTGYAKIPAGTTTTYPVSTNPNAYQEGDDAKPAGYTLGEVVTGSFKLGRNDSSSGWNYGIGTKPTVNDDGTFKSLALGLTTSNFINASNLKTAIAGKFVQLIGYNGYSSPPDTSGPFSSVPGPVIFVPTDVKCTVTNSVLIIDRYQPVTGYAAIPAGTIIEYLGCLGDKARVRHGTYVGTGTFGANTPNTINAPFTPIFLLVMTKESRSYANFALFVYGATTGITVGPSSANREIPLYVTWNEQSISWYNMDSNYDGTAQMNASGSTYVYVVIG